MNNNWGLPGPGPYYTYDDYGFPTNPNFRPPPRPQQLNDYGYDQNNFQGSYNQNFGWPRMPLQNPHYADDSWDPGQSLAPRGSQSFVGGAQQATWSHHLLRPLPPQPPAPASLLPPLPPTNSASNTSVMAPSKQNATATSAARGTRWSTPNNTGAPSSTVTSAAPAAPTRLILSSTTSTVTSINLTPSAAGGESRLGPTASLTEFITNYSDKTGKVIDVRSSTVPSAQGSIAPVLMLRSPPSAPANPNPTPTTMPSTVLSEVTARLNTFITNAAMVEKANQNLTTGPQSGQDQAAQPITPGQSAGTSAGTAQSAQALPNVSTSRHLLRQSRPVGGRFAISQNVAGVPAQSSNGHLSFLTNTPMSAGPTLPETVPTIQPPLPPSTLPANPPLPQGPQPLRPPLPTVPPPAPGMEIQKRSRTFSSSIAKRSQSQRSSTKTSSTLQASREAYRQRLSLAEYKATREQALLVPQPPNLVRAPTAGSSTSVGNRLQTQPVQPQRPLQPLMPAPSAWAFHSEHSQPKTHIPCEAYNACRFFIYEHHVPINAIPAFKSWTTAHCKQKPGEPGKMIWHFDNHSHSQVQWVFTSLNPAYVLGPIPPFPAPPPPSNRVGPGVVGSQPVDPRRPPTLPTRELQQNFHIPCEFYNNCRFSIYTYNVPERAAHAFKRWKTACLRPSTPVEKAVWHFPNQTHQQVQSLLTSLNPSYILDPIPSAPPSDPATRGPEVGGTLPVNQPRRPGTNTVVPQQRIHIPCEADNSHRFFIYEQHVPKDAATVFKSWTVAQLKRKSGERGRMIWEFPNQAHHKVQSVLSMSSLNPSFVLGPLPSSSTLPSDRVTPDSGFGSEPVDPRRLSAPQVQPPPQVTKPAVPQMSSEERKRMDRQRRFAAEQEQQKGSSTSQAAPVVVDFIDLSPSSSPESERDGTELVAPPADDNFEIPGFEIIHHLVLPSILPRSSDLPLGRFCQSIRIEVPPPALQLLASNTGKMMVVLRLGLAKDSAPVPRNNKIIRIEKIGLNGQELPPKPQSFQYTIEITKWLGGANQLVTEISASVDECGSEDTIFGCISIVRKLSAEEMLTRLTAKPKIPVSQTMQMVSERLADDIENGILISDPSLPSSIMLCPLGKSKITTPCRGARCKHYTCFDAGNFLQTYARSQNWTCPICDGQLDFDDLVVDSYFENILTALVDDVQNYHVKILQDGEYLIQTIQTQNLNQGVKTPAVIALIEDDDVVDVSSSESDEELPTSTDTADKASVNEPNDEDILEILSSDDEILILHLKDPLTLEGSSDTTGTSSTHFSQRPGSGGVSGSTASEPSPKPFLDFSSPSEDVVAARSRVLDFLDDVRNCISVPVESDQSSIQECSNLPNATQATNVTTFEKDLPRRELSCTSTKNYSNEAAFRTAAVASILGVDAIMVPNSTPAQTDRSAWERDNVGTTIPSSDQAVVPATTIPLASPPSSTTAFTSTSGWRARSESPISSDEEILSAATTRALNILRRKEYSRNASSGQDTTPTSLSIAAVAAAVPIQKGRSDWRCSDQITISSSDDEPSSGLQLNDLPRKTAENPIMRNPSSAANENSVWERRDSPLISFLDEEAEAVRPVGSPSMSDISSTESDIIQRVLLPKATQNVSNPSPSAMVVPSPSLDDITSAESLNSADEALEALDKTILNISGSTHTSESSHEEFVPPVDSSPSQEADTTISSECEQLDLRYSSDESIGSSSCSSSKTTVIPNSPNMVQNTEKQANVGSSQEKNGSSADESENEHNANAIHQDQAYIGKLLSTNVRVNVRRLLDDEIPHHSQPSPADSSAPTGPRRRRIATARKSRSRRKSMYRESSESTLSSFSSESTESSSSESESSSSSCYSPPPPRRKRRKRTSAMNSSEEEVEEFIDIASEEMSEEETQEQNSSSKAREPGEVVFGASKKRKPPQKAKPDTVAEATRRFVFSK